MLAQLFSCETGQGPHPTVKELAKELGRQWQHLIKFYGYTLMGKRLQRERSGCKWKNHGHGHLTERGGGERSSPCILFPMKK